MLLIKNLRQYGRLNPKNLKPFLMAVTTWNAEAKINFIIGVKYHAKRFDPETVHASYFVEHDVLGDMPAVMKAYIDLDKFARDLVSEYTQTEIAGETIIYRTSETE